MKPTTKVNELLNKLSITLDELNDVLAFTVQDIEDKIDADTTKNDLRDYVDEHYYGLDVTRDEELNYIVEVEQFKKFYVAENEEEAEELEEALNNIDNRKNKEMIERANNDMFDKLLRKVDFDPILEKVQTISLKPEYQKYLDRESMTYDEVGAVFDDFAWQDWKKERLVEEYNNDIEKCLEDFIILGYFNDPIEYNYFSIYYNCRKSVFDTTSQEELRCYLFEMLQGLLAKIKE